MLQSIWRQRAVRQPPPPPPPPPTRSRFNPKNKYYEHDKTLSGFVIIFMFTPAILCDVTISWVLFQHSTFTLKHEQKLEFELLCFSFVYFLNFKFFHHTLELTLFWSISSRWKRLSNICLQYSLDVSEISFKQFKIDLNTIFCCKI